MKTIDTDKLLEYAEENWLPSQIEMLKRAIEEVNYKKYRAEYLDEECEIFYCENDLKAFQKAREYEKDHGVLLVIVVYS